MTFIYKEIVDMRGCTPCDCTPPMGVTCEVTADLFADSLCSGSGVPEMLNNCNQLPNPIVGATVFIQAYLGPPMGGSCIPTTTSMPTGVVYGSAPTMVCCLP